MSANLLREHLSRTPVPDERREMRRRIAEDLLSVASRDQSWSVFFHQLKRLRGLGFSSLDRYIHTCFLSTQAAKREREGRPTVRRMILSARRKIQDSSFPKRWKEEQLTLLDRLQSELAD